MTHYWWWNVIGIPMYLGDAVLLLDGELTDAERRDAIAVLSVAEPDFAKTGQNFAWMAENRLRRGLLARDEKTVRTALEDILREVRMSEQEGIRPDWCFHQHGQQPQFGNYGLSFLCDQARLAAILAGTDYPYPSEKLALVRNLAAEGYAWILWKGRMDVSAMGRQLDCGYPSKKAAAVDAAFRNLEKSGWKRPAAPVGFRYFDRSAYAVFRTDRWMASVRASTPKIVGTETWINEDNVKGMCMADGALMTYVTGAEYDGALPLWDDWRMIPGVTGYLGKPVNRNDSRNQKNDIVASGDRDRGTFAFTFAREGLTAHKKWTFDRGGVTCEGTGITATDGAYAVATCVEHALAAPDAGVLYQRADESRFRNGPVTYTVYAPPEAIRFEVAERQGDYNTFMQAHASKPVSGKVFSLRILHGTKPAGASYRYRIDIPTRAPDACVTGRSAAPAVVDVDCGRQLFVDDWVIAATDGIVRHWNAPTKREDPILTPTSEKDGRTAPGVYATDGGLWWDPKIRKYRLWYETGWCGTLRYAESADGLAWEYPDLGVVPGSNQLFAKCSVDTFSVFPDYAQDDPYAQWNLFVSDEGCHSADDTLYTSADGKRFTRLGVVGASGDRSSMYYDPFRRKWVWSLRDYWDGRCRRYADADTFAVSKDTYAVGRCAKWTEIPSGNLYSFTAVPYESLMVGAMELLGDLPRETYYGRGDNAGCADAGLPKQTRLQFAFSRDGRTYAQGGAACGIKPSGWGSGKWDTGYLSAVGGLFVIRDERLWIYYTALRGDATKNTDAGYDDGNDNGLYLNGSIGAATLRRDGFAGLVADGRGSVLTRPLRFTGAHLFVNAECRYGSVRAEILDEKGVAIPGYAAADCTALSCADTTKRELVFKGGDLRRLGDRKVSIRFQLTTATLYSFWISPSVRGESRGYVAAGGPAYGGLRDE